MIAQTDPLTGVEYIVAALLQSPHFCTVQKSISTVYKTTAFRYINSTPGLWHRDSVSSSGTLAPDSELLELAE